MSNSRDRVIPVVRAVMLMIVLAGSPGCATVWERIRDQIERPAPHPPAPDPVPEPAPEPVPQPQPQPDPTPAPQPPPPAASKSDAQWIPDRGDGRAVIRVLASMLPNGYSIITADGHRHIDPSSTVYDDWMRANNKRPPHRITADGYAEWVLDISGVEIARRAQAFNMRSGVIVMVFHTRSPSGNYSHFLDPRFPHGTPDGRPIIPNKDNKNWGDAW